MRLAVILSLAALVLAGCTGIPEGAAGPFDQVDATVTVTDAETGQVLLQDQSVQFRIGSGDSGLGLQFERAAIRHAPGDSFQVQVRDDPTLDFQAEVERSAILNDLPLEDQVDNTTWLNAFGEEPAVGDRAPWAGTPYDLVVVSVEDGTVTYRVDAQQDEVQPADSIAADILFHVTGDSLQIELLPREGETFQVQANPFTGQTFHDLEPGTYLHLGRDGDTVRYASAGGTDAALLGRDLDIKVTIVSVTATPTAEDLVNVDGDGHVEGGNYGARPSTVLNGAADPDPHYGPMGSDGSGAPSDDDHGDDGHGH